jgi:hypothetical protein
LPDPARGGSINELRPFLNVGSDGDFVLTVSFLLAAWSGRGPYPILNLIGEQGSAKSTFTRVLKKLLDPGSTTLRSLPANERDLYIAAYNSFVLLFDNISWLLDWLSDAFCRLSTGGGFGTRELYADLEEILFDAMRVIILNGIVEFASRPDLADRLIVLSLPPIPDDKRRAEKQMNDGKPSFWEELEPVYPRILGALLDGVVHGLRCRPNTRLSTLPRMADFALWATACETAFWPAGTFMAAYERNREEAIQAVIEASLVASAVQALMADWKGTQWEGTATELLAALGHHVDERQVILKTWPKTPDALSYRLRPAVATLRRVGIEVTFDRENARRVPHPRDQCVFPQRPRVASQNMVQGAASKPRKNRFAAEKRGGEGKDPGEHHRTDQQDTCHTRKSPIECVTQPCSHATALHLFAL